MDEQIPKEPNEGSEVSGEELSAAPLEDESKEGRLNGGVQMEHGKRRILTEILLVWIVLRALFTVTVQDLSGSWFLASGVGNALVCMAVCFLGVRHSFRIIDTGNTKKALSYGVGIGVIFPAIVLLSYFGGQHVLPPEYGVFASSGVFGKLLVSLFVAGIGPIIEELLFRGFFYSMLRTRFGVAWATLLSSLLFAGMHPLGIAKLISTFLRGLVFAWAYQKSRSIWGSVIAHVMNNATYILLFCLA